MDLCKFVVFAPNDEQLIKQIIQTAATLGAGKVGDHYTDCAFLLRGKGTWTPTPGADPQEGEIEKFTSSEEVKIEMEAPQEKIEEIAHAIRAIHPYDEISIDYWPIKRIAFKTPKEE